VFVRRGHDGTTVEVGEGLIAVAYVHRMSRSLTAAAHARRRSETSRAARTAGSPRCTVRRCIGRRRPPAISTNPSCARRSATSSAWNGVRCATAPPSSPASRRRSSLSVFESAGRRSARGRARRDQPRYEGGRGGGRACDKGAQGVRDRHPHLARGSPGPIILLNKFTAIQGAMTCITGRRNTIEYINSFRNHIN